MTLSDWYQPDINPSSRGTWADTCWAGPWPMTIEPLCGTPIIRRILSFNMGMPILVRHIFVLKQGPGSLAHVDNFRRSSYGSSLYI